MGWGAAYGAVSGVLINLVLAIAMALSAALIERDIATGLGLGLLIAVIGSMVAAVLGVGIGAIFGLLLGAIGIERHAPLVAALTAAGFPLVTMASSIVEDLGADETQSMAIYAIGVAALLGFAGAGYVAGTGFHRASTRAQTVQPIQQAPVPNDAAIEPLGDLRPAVTLQRPR